MSVVEFPKSERNRTIPEALAEMAVEPDVERVVLLGELTSGGTVVIASQMTNAQANWIIDRAKKVLLGDES